MEYQTRMILIKDKIARNQAINWLSNAPDGVEVVIREPVKKRTAEQNRYQWGGMIKDFVEQGWLDGRTYSPDAWNYMLKHMFLPDQEIEGITRKGYQKFVDTPMGLKLLGSTTDLTVKGMAQYLTECFAWGSQELGIRFTTLREY